MFSLYFFLFVLVKINLSPRNILENLQMILFRKKMCSYILLKLIYFYFICNGILPSCYVPAVSLEARRGHQILGNGVTDSRELRHGAEN